MLPITIILFTLAALFLALSLRGRTVARGVFCRRCRFDLAGLDIAGNPTCPECGRNLTKPDATRSTLRRVHRPGLVLALLLMSASVGLLGVQLPNAGSRIVGAMPDSVVVALTELGVDSALTAVTNRLTRTPPLAPGQLDRLIDDALAHQADAGTSWDARWGDVLATAFLNGRMSDEEAMRYFNAGSVSGVVVRDKIVHGEGELHYKIVESTSDRIAVTGLFSRVGHTGYLVAFENIRVTMDAPRLEFEPVLIGASGFSIPRGNFSSVAIKRSVPIRPGAWVGVASGQTVVVTTFDTVLFRGADDHEIGRTAHRIEQAVTILPAGADLVQMQGSVEAAAAAGAALRIPLLKVLRPVPSPPDNPQPVASAQIEIHGLPVAVAARVFVLDGQRETEIGRFLTSSQPDQSSMNYSFVTWFVPETNLRVSESLVDDWLALGVVDIILRPDPEHALSEPGIESIIGTPLIFRGVPVVAIYNPSQLFSSRAGLAGITATPLTESD